MTNDAYIENPALRPTVLVHEVMKTVYRAESSKLPAARAEAIDQRIARETNRAA